MRRNLASPVLLEQPVSSDRSVCLPARVHQRVTWVDLLTPSIQSAAVSPSLPPTLQPRGTTLAALLETVVPHCSRLAAASVTPQVFNHRH
jgi:hypothetical protein